MCVWKNVYSVPLPIFLLACLGFFLLLLGCTNSLYILDINPLSHIWFVSIFSNSVSCFHFLIVSFAVQKLFSLMSHLLSFAFVAGASVVMS